MNTVCAKRARKLRKRGVRVHYFNSTERGSARFIRDEHSRAAFEAWINYPEPGMKLPS